MKVSDEAVEAAAKAWTRIMCGCYDPEDVPDLHDELRKILKAAAPHIAAQAKAEGWDACVGVVEAATRLVAPDDITPMGARVITRAANKNPYRSQA